MARAPSIPPYPNEELWLTPERDELKTLNVINLRGPATLREFGGDILSHKFH